MKDVLTQITDPNVVLEIIATQSSYLEARKSIEERNVKKIDDVEPKAATKPKLKQNMYNDYSDNTREVFIDRMLEIAEERGRIVRFAKELDVEPRTARRWWKRYQETNEVLYKLSKNNVDRPSSFTTEHETYIRELLDNDPQLYSEDIIGELSKEFMGFSISKTQLNHHLRNNMLVTIKNLHLNPKLETLLIT
ncbi:hypothetical protein G6F57_007204 [Rhizopus arrhizus]|uniref:Uncharacterized protein n=1 Tax=Rhizopus oryzae TaxID=64495 RepID=A0A9P7BQZ8_RHIOR|nr:hypothetical protein G6F23_003110 [Rhizopus arrhizus]KAG1421402.1 hypothetical protein G6F58_003762 [Rhizopus delemar]KAG0762274.1 hypothetical protein G6F24_006919 [Rhizopus arrhizus]KAG0789378.1 hypothetical protein G6F21_006555 [Rhizopus arrhizus]KAG0799978.1 hypothetical protein G6F22_002691 [Rhizopus arrhizus]